VIYYNFYHLLICYYAVFISAPEMIRNGMLSFSVKDDNQRTAETWLEKYFEVQGDHDPENGDIALQISLNEEAYEIYKNDMTDDQRGIVSLERFNELWRVMFPHARKRPYCAIPGKCALCAEIDRQRRLAIDVNHRRQLRDAHLLHRCGMFMAERRR
jgi:hypothetical protein